jgi:predicted nuclease of predicted toxin-antitoxin system
MKLLFDQNLSYRLCGLLDDLFPGSAQVSQLHLDQATDRQIWEFAAQHDYTVVTQDGDFAELSALYGAPPKVVWLRCGNRPTTLISELIRNNAETILTLYHDDALSMLEIM